MKDLQEKVSVIIGDVRTAFNQIKDRSELSLDLLNTFAGLYLLVEDIKKTGLIEFVPPEEEWDMQLPCAANETIYEIREDLGINTEEYEDEVDIEIATTTLSGYITDAFIAGAVYATKNPRPKPYEK